MGNKTRFTIRLDQDLKDKMDRLDVNWSQYLRNAIRDRIGENKRRAVQKLVDDYQGSLSRLWVLHMLSYGISKRHVYETAELVLDGLEIDEEHTNTDDVVDAVHEDLKERGLATMYEVIEGTNLNIGTVIRGEIDERTQDPFEEEVRNRIQNRDENSQLEVGVRTLALFLWDRFDEEQASLVPDGLRQTWQFAASNEDDNVDLEDLVRTGLLYKDYRSSNAYSHPKWRVPDYALDLIEELKEDPSTGGIDRIGVKKESVIDTFKEGKDGRKFLDWMNGRVKYVLKHKEMEEIESELDEEGIELDIQEFEEVRQDLVQKGIVIIAVSPHRSSTGRRSSRPAKYRYKLTDPALDHLEVLL